MTGEERHWQDDDLLRKLYGLEPERAVSGEHLAVCPECSGRWEKLQLARAKSLSEAGTGVVPDERLLAQRKAVWARIDHPRRFWMSKWAPAAATSLMLAAGVLLLHPQRPLPAPAQPASRTAQVSAKAAAAAQISDAELFSDLSAMASPAAPKAVEPIRGLFESSGTDEEGSY